MHRAFAIIERELRKFFRSPALMLTSMIFPLVQLLVLGNAFGGKIHNAKVAVVDYDNGPQSTRIHEALLAVQNNARTYTIQEYGNDRDAVHDLKNGKVNGVIVIPAQFSRKYYEEARPQVGLVVDNTDSFVTAALEQNLADMVADFNRPEVQSRLPQQIALQTVELYPYIEYIKYLLPGAITLAIFVSVMIGGGIVYIDDKARGVHEGYLVTPITKLELVTGLNTAGAIKAVMSGIVLTFIGSFLAGVGSAFSPLRLLWLLVLIVFTAFAFISMMSMMMARVDDPLIPRAVFGILNTLLYFPSGAIYPIEAFPKWLRVIARVDPFSYAVHGFKQLLLKDAGISAVFPDFVYLGIFCAVTFAGTVLLFKRTL
ncbi:MAG: ABC transporter permease [Acidobacteriales bacterium]|nr:ABC transporter permease [Terriglobales bacterium]